MKSPILLLVLGTLVLSGCRTHKEMTTSEVTVTNDSISSDLTSNSELKTEAFDFLDFSADDLQIIFKADSVKIGDTVIYNPEITTTSKKPKVQENSGQKSETKHEVKSELKAGSNTSSQKESEEVREVKRSFTWALPIAIIASAVLLFFLLVYWYRHR